VKIIAAESFDSADIFDIKYLCALCKNLGVQESALGGCIFNMLGRIPDNASFSRVKNYSNLIAPKALHYAINDFAINTSVPLYNYKLIPNPKTESIKNEIHNKINITANITTLGELYNSSAEPDFFIDKTTFNRLEDFLCSTHCCKVVPDELAAAYPECASLLAELTKAAQNPDISPLTLSLYIAIYNTYIIGKARKISSPKVLQPASEKQADLYFIPCRSTMQGRNYTCDWSQHIKMSYNEQTKNHEAFVSFKKGDSFKISKKHWQNTLEFKHLLHQGDVAEPENDFVGGCNIRVTQDGIYHIFTNGKNISCSRTGPALHSMWQISGCFAACPHKAWVCDDADSFLKTAASPLPDAYPDALFDCYTKTLDLNAGDQFKICVVDDSGQWVRSADARHIQNTQYDFGFGDDICGPNILANNSGRYTFYLLVEKEPSDILAKLVLIWKKQP